MAATDLLAFAFEAFAVVLIIGLVIVASITFIRGLDEALERLPVVGKHLALLIWVAWTCITAGLLVVEVLIPRLPPSPLNPL